MNSDLSCKVGWRRALLAVMVGGSLCAALGLAACGGNAEQASEPEATPSDAQAPAAEAPSAVYAPEKYVINGNDGSTQAWVTAYDDQGRQLSQSTEVTGTDSDFKTDITVTEWDEFGHIMKMEEVDDLGNGATTSTTAETTAIDVNEDGIMSSTTMAYKTNKESFAEGEIASQTVTQTVEYGSDVQIARKFETKVEMFDQSGALVTTRTTTKEFDEDGLQTGYGIKLTNADGTEYSFTADFTWTKDAEGKLVSVQVVYVDDGAEPKTSTGDVTVDESGLISSVSNIVTEGEAQGTSATVSRTKIENPLPNGYEGWKSFPVSDLIFNVY